MTEAGATYDILLQGNPFCDLTFTFQDRDALPLLGQEVFASDFAINPGGIFNIASALARLGLRVGLRTTLGNDIFSRFIAERMEKSFLPLDLVSWVDRPLPVVTAGISFPHDRLFISYEPPEEDLPPYSGITIADLDRYQPRVLFTYGGEDLDVYREARRRGILIYVDAAWDPERLQSCHLRQILPTVDVFSPNLPEALEITRTDNIEEALAVLSRQCACVVIKSGARGCIAVREGRRYDIPAIPIESVETTGAGDNFNAGLIYALLQGYPFETCLHCANITGGLSTRVLGGCESGFTAEDVEEWLRRVESH